MLKTCLSYQLVTNLTLELEPQNWKSNHVPPPIGHAHWSKCAFLQKSNRFLSRGNPLRCKPPAKLIDREPALKNIVI